VAERLYEAGRGVAEGVADADHELCMLFSDIARTRALISAGRSGDALQTLTRIRPRIELCGDTLVRVNYRTTMCAALYRMDRFEEAMRLAADAVELATSFGPDSSEALDAMCLQGQVLAAISGIEEAKTIMGHVLAARTRLLGPDHELTRMTRHFLRQVEAASPG